MKFNQLQRNIVEYRKKDPNSTLREIADQFNISREYVRLVLKGANMEPASCGWRKKIALSKIRKTCPNCSGKKASTARLCQECTRKSHRIPVACAYCGTLIGIVQSQVLYKSIHGQKDFFCCRQHRVLYHWHGPVGTYVKGSEADHARCTEIWVREHPNGAFGFQPGHISYGRPSGSKNKHHKERLPKVPRIPKEPRLPLQHIAVRQLVLQGYSEKEICFKLGCSKSTYYRAHYLGCGKEQVPYVTVYKRRH